MIDARGELVHQAIDLIVSGVGLLLVRVIRQATRTIADAVERFTLHGELIDQHSTYLETIGAPKFRRVRKSSLIAAIALLVATPAHAQIETTPGSWAPGGRAFANASSYATVGVELGLDTLASWRAEDRGRAFGCQALRYGVTLGGAALLKHVIHETRPDGSDALSFPSEHSWFAGAAAGFNLSVSLPLAFWTAYGRLAANKHHPRDVVAGVLLGAATARLPCH